MACLPIHASSDDVRGSLTRMPSDSVAFIVAQDSATRRSVADALSSAGFLTLTIDDPANAARYVRAMRPTIIAIDADSYGQNPHPDPSPFRVTTDDLEIDITSRVVRREGQWVDLTPREFDLLSLLVRRAPQAVPRAELLREVSVTRRRIGVRSVDMHVLALRRKLERTPASPRHIRTASGVGYRFEP